MEQELVRKIAEAEWRMFDAVNRGTGLRASCQEDPETFFIMRTSQAEAWTEALRESYYADLLAAEAEGRNLLTEKYARMMESTDPAAFAQIRELLPPVDEETLRLTLGEAVAHFEETPPKGEFVIVVDGAPEPVRAAGVGLPEALAAVARYRDGGLSLKDAAKRASEETGFSKKALYDAALKQTEDA